MAHVGEDLRHVRSATGASVGGDSDHRVLTSGVVYLQRTAAETLETKEDINIMNCEQEIM